MSIGTSHIFHLDYPIFVDGESPINIVEKKIEGINFRIYPPFTDKTTQFRGESMSVSPLNIPFRRHRTINRALIQMQPMPVFSFTFNPSAVNPLTVYARNADQNGRYEELGPGKAYADSLRLDVYLDNWDSAEDPWSIATSKADWLHKKMMALLRWHTRQWWIARSNWITRSGGQTFAIDGNGDPIRLTTYRGAQANVPMPGPEVLTVNQTTWDRMLTSLQNGEETPIVDVMLMDAAYFGSINDYRQAVLNAASACDQEKEMLFERLWMTAHPGTTYNHHAYKRGYLEGRSLPTHIDTTLDATPVNRSYKSEYPVEWDLVKNLYQARNNVAHGGPCSYGEPNTPLIPVTEPVEIEFNKAAKHCVAWLRSLP